MLSRRELGFAGAGRPLRNVAAGFAIGFGSFTAAAALALLAGARAPNLSHTGRQFLHSLGGAVITAIVVAIIEETIFRAALFGVLRKCFSFPLALLLSSAIYASVHFLQKAAPPAHIGWLSGLAMLPQMLRGPPDGLPLVPTFFTLLVVGAILALAYQRTGTLFMSIGLHAGWVFWVKSYGFLTRQTPAAARAVWGGDKLIDGWCRSSSWSASFSMLRPAGWPPLQILPKMTSHPIPLQNRAGRGAEFLLSAGLPGLPGGAGGGGGRFRRPGMPGPSVRFVAAPFCERCGLPFEGEISHPFQCANCQEVKLYFRSARSAVVANSLMLEVIHRYKYNRSLWFEPFLAGLLISRAAPVLAAEDWDFIVPVPLYPVKKREREFNQAGASGGPVGRAAKIPVNERAAPACQTHHDANPADAGRAGGQRASGVRVLRKEKIGWRKNCAAG